MSIIEQATKRLEELRRGGVEVPWSAAGLTEERFNALVRRDAAVGGEAATPPQPGRTERSEVTALPVAAMQRKAADPGPAPSPAARAPISAPRQATGVEIDLARLARQGYLVPELVRSDLALEFRRIKRPLLANAADREKDGSRNALIMITSALPGEGKTFCAVNLAMSMAMEVDTSVLLVDADVIRPMVLERLGLPPAPGLPRRPDRRQDGPGRRDPAYQRPEAVHPAVGHAATSCRASCWPAARWAAC